MPILLITQAGPNVDVVFEGDGLARQRERRPFSFELSAQDSEDIRWYLEDYLIYPVDPLPKTARGSKSGCTRSVGNLFRAFCRGATVGASAKRGLEETSIEVESDIANTTP